MFFQSIHSNFIRPQPKYVNIKNEYHLKEPLGKTGFDKIDQDIFFAIFQVNATKNIMIVNKNTNKQTIPNAQIPY